jgi:hypothetical protein
VRSDGQFVADSVAGAVDRPDLVTGSSLHFNTTPSSGAPSAGATPSFLLHDYELQIVRSRRAYAQFSSNTVTDYGVLKLYSRGGRFCGDLRVEQGSQLSVGEDGTEMALSGAGRCTIHWWPGLLR